MAARLRPRVQSAVRSRAAPGAAAPCGRAGAPGPHRDRQFRCRGRGLHRCGDRTGLSRRHGTAGPRRCVMQSMQARGRPPIQRRRAWASAALRRWTCAALAWLTTAAWADLTDEIQVYADDINAPGEFHLELHLNTTPSGRSTPEYPGEITPAHGIRLTPEFSYGLTPDLEAGLYLPTVRASGGRPYLPGLKLRVKWRSSQPRENGGAFPGVKVELSPVTAPLIQDRRTHGTRPLLGWRNA